MPYTLTVYGDPGPQGSKKYVGKGVMIESSKKVKPWREACKWAVIESPGSVAGPVAVDITFTLKKPKSAPKKRVTYPDRKPDLDKLYRSTLDALVQAGVIEDDARVVSLSGRKVFPNEHERALETLGAVIHVTEVSA